MEGREVDTAGLPEAAVNFLFPPTCILCKCRCDTGFCLNCQKLLPWLRSGCDICSAPIKTSGRCGRCLVTPPAFRDSTIPFRYESPISNLVQSLKYSGALHIAHPLANMISNQVNQKVRNMPGALVPVPLHRNRIMQRGFNQAAELARILGRIHQIPVHYSAIKRTRNTLTQTGLNETMRRRNVTGAFTATDRLPPYVALVDDVVTSGSTVNAAAAALVNSGVKRVSIWAIAKT